MKASVLYIPLIILLCGWSAHPIHISVTEIVLDEKENELEIIARIFTDDLEASIRVAREQPELSLLGLSRIETNQLIEEYLGKRIKLSLDQHNQKVKYLGHEVEGDAMLCYLQVSNVKEWKSIDIFNTIITEVYEDQSNLVHVTVRGKLKSLRLVRDNPSGKLSF